MLKKALNDTVNEFTSNGYVARGIKVEKMIDHTIETFGKVDILINNAGIGVNMQAAANVTDGVWNRVMNISVNGVMYTMRKIIPLFIENGGGTIINMASITGITGGRGGITYTTAKHAVVGMTKNVASQYRTQNIRCNALAPASVQTEFSASTDNVNKFGMEEATRGVNFMLDSGAVNDIANIVLFLASTDSNYINGVALAADDGWSAY